MAYILMIDDNPQTQRYIERIIRHRTRHEIDFAGSKDQGIEKMVERRPQVILLDLFIPGDGFELFEILRKHPATQDIPLVIITAVPFDQITLMRLKRMRYEGLIECPIEASELNRILDIALKRNSIIVRKWEPPSV